MKIKEINEVIPLPKNMDVECIDLCNALNRLPGLETFESCCGHGNHPYHVFFKCTNIETISRLARAVDRNYSDGHWEIVADSTDTDPYGIFWLRTKTVLEGKELATSVTYLINGIMYWFDDKFDDYFKPKQVVY